MEHSVIGSFIIISFVGRIDVGTKVVSKAQVCLGANPVVVKAQIVSDISCGPVTAFEELGNVKGHVHDQIKV